MAWLCGCGQVMLQGSQGREGSVDPVRCVLRELIMLREGKEGSSGEGRRMRGGGVVAYKEVLVMLFVLSCISTKRRASSLIIWPWIHTYTYRSSSCRRNSTLDFKLPSRGTYNTRTLPPLFTLTFPSNFISQEA